MIAALLTLLTSTAFIVSASLILLIAMTVLLEFEFEGWATTLCSLGIALWLWNFGGSIWGYISVNPLNTLGFIVGYIVIGIIWSIVRWNEHVKGVFRKFNTIKKDFLSENGLQWPLDGEQRKGFIKILNENGFSLYENMTIEEMSKKLTPKASEKATIITSWLMFWPVSLMGTLLNNPFKRFFMWVYSVISGIYDKITNSHREKAFGVDK